MHHPSDSENRRLLTQYTSKNMTSTKKNLQIKLVKNLIVDKTGYNNFCRKMHHLRDLEKIVSEDSGLKHSPKSRANLNLHSKNIPEQ